MPIKAQQIPGVCQLHAVLNESGHTFSTPPIKYTGPVAVPRLSGRPPRLPHYLSYLHTPTIRISEKILFDIKDPARSAYLRLKTLDDHPSILIIALLLLP